MRISFTFRDILMYCSISLFFVLFTSYPVAAALEPDASVLGNYVPVSAKNGQTITGSNQIRIYGPWRGKDTGTLNKGYADMEGGSSAQTIRLVVYELSERNGGYAPGTLVGTSDPVNIAAGQSRRWVEFTFPQGGEMKRNARYGFGVWFTGSGGAKLWTEDRYGGRWDVSASNTAPSSLQLSPDTNRNEDLAGLYITLNVAPLAPPQAGYTRLSPGELPLTTAVTNPFAGPHRWSDQTTVPGMEEKIAYKRFTWDQIEGSTPGSYNWAIIDREIAAAKSRGQMYAFRVRARISEYKVPSYLSGRTYNDAYFRERHKALHQAMKARYDTSPDIAWIDLDGPGNYGEWAGGDFNQISASAKQDVVSYLSQIWGDAKVRTVVFTAQASETNTLRTAIPSAGFRNDIWGGEGAGAQMWSGQSTRQRMDMLKSGELNVPVLGEIDSAINKWSVRTLYTNILWFGAHTISNGNFKGHNSSFSTFSAQEQAELKEAFLKLGYRLVVSNVDVPQTMRLNNPEKLIFYWQNRNVNAPVGKDRGTVYLRLIASNGQTAGSFPLQVSTGNLLPTGRQPHRVEETITFTGIPAGTYQMQIMVITPYDRVISLANTGRTADGAYPLGSVTLTDNGTVLEPTLTATNPTPTPIESPNFPISPTPTGVTPTVTISVPQEQCPQKKKGDANFDGVVNLRDLRIWQSEFFGEQQTRNADFDGRESNNIAVSLVDLEIWTRTFLESSE